MLYKPTAEGESEIRAKVIKVHPDAEGAHYTILPQGEAAKEKNTTSEHISKVHNFGFGFVHELQYGRAHHLQGVGQGFIFDSSVSCMHVV